MNLQKAFNTYFYKYQTKIHNIFIIFIGKKNTFFHIEYNKSQTNIVKTFMFPVNENDDGVNRRNFHK